MKPLFQDILPKFCGVVKPLAVEEDDSGSLLIKKINKKNLCKFQLHCLTWIYATNS